MRLGILGGTFDPVHVGHLAMARAALAGARLERILMIPCNQPPHKDRPAITDPYLRLGMLALLVPEEPLLTVSTVELRRGGVSFTVDTLRELGELHPGSDLFLVVGSDSFAEMTIWRANEEILSRAAVIVLLRPGIDEAALRSGLVPDLSSILRPAGAPWPERLEGNLPLAGIVDMEPVDVSSTEIRRRVTAGSSIEGLVPPAVSEFIKRQELYA
jgi:nicotinate-nucleotide adenylyltransferase